MESLQKNQTWELIKKPESKKTVGYKWIFKLKEGIPGVEPKRFKARLVAKGFTQKEKERVEFTEVFSLVVRHTSIRLILSHVIVYDMHLERMDVKIAFLHCELKEEIVMDQPEGFIDLKRPNWVCLLRKSLYGLKQSPRQWYLRFDNHMQKLNFQRCNFDCCVYFKRVNEGDLLYLILYVDDMLLTCRDMKQIVLLK